MTNIKPNLKQLSVVNNKPKNIAVCVDDSKCGKLAFEFCKKLVSSKDKINIIHASCSKSNQSNVDKYYLPIHKKNPKIYNYKVIPDTDNSSVRDRVCKYVNNTRNNIDYLISGSHGINYERNLSQINTNDHKSSKSVLGSFSDCSLRQCSCTSIIVPPKFEINDNRDYLIYVIGVDGSSNSHNALIKSLELARKKDKIHVLHVKTPAKLDSNILITPKQFTSENVKTLYMTQINELNKNRKNNKIKYVELEGTVVSQTITNYAQSINADILCVGTDGMTAFIKRKNILGSVSDACVRITQNVCVLVAHLSEFNSTRVIMEQLKRQYSPRNLED